MTTISEYTTQLENIDILQNIDCKISTVTEAEKNLEICDHCLHQLIAIKTSIALDINKIRSEYSHRIEETSSISSRIINIINENGPESQSTIAAKRNLLIERDNILAKYQQLKLLIDYHRQGIEGRKYHINDLIIDIENTRMQKKKWFENQSKAIYCHYCDSKMAHSHRFCCQCGEATPNKLVTLNETESVV